MRDREETLVPTPTWIEALNRLRYRLIITDEHACRRLWWGAIVLVLLLPAALMAARALADAMMVGVALLFLLDRAGARDWTWLRAPWTALGLMVWAWMVVCSVLMAGIPGVAQAVAALRFFIFIPALECWVLTDRRARLWLHAVVILAALWVAGECWQQLLFQTNVFGMPRFVDGALTGPFLRPRAGPIYLELMFPAVLPALLALTRRPGRIRWAAALGLLALAVVTMILIGQRMPTMLMLLGLVLTALMFRRFRLPIVLTVVAGAVLLALTPIVSPPTFAKLVVRFGSQMEHFWTTAYGLIFARAVTMIQAHPWLGLGWDGFRNHCMDAAYLVQPSWLPAGDPTSNGGCAIHPHNYWTQVGTTAGVPAMVMWAVLVGLWLWRLGRGGIRGNGRRAALLVFIVVSMWPLASTTSLFTVPNAGFTFMLIAWGLAEARDQPDPTLVSSAT
jgi:O-antigen ligase